MLIMALKTIICTACVDSMLDVGGLKTELRFFALTIWNSLPLDIQNSNNLISFKQAAKDHNRKSV
jgi:hypothetical protein